MSSMAITPRPVATCNPSSVVRISPGAPPPSTNLAPNNFTSRPSSSVHAPGVGSKARMTRTIRSAGSLQRMRRVSRVTLGAYVARAWSCGRGVSWLVSSSASASTSAWAPISERCSDSHSVDANQRDRSTITTLPWKSPT